MNDPVLAQGYNVEVSGNLLARGLVFDRFYRFLPQLVDQRSFVTYNLKSFNEFVKVDNLYSAWRRFRNGKRERKDVIVFERYLELELTRLSEDLITGRYQHSGYHNFFVTDPKYRAIHKATVRDRIVHDALYNVLYPFFDRRFFFDSYSCRLNKGTQAAITRIWEFILQESKNLNQEVFIFHGDVDSFFASVDHGILLRLISRRVKDKDYIKLCRTIISSFDLGNRKGIPLGNLTSQVFANIYLHELDYYVKQVRGVRAYVRYNDDFYIVSADKDFLKNISRDLQEFLQSTLGLVVPDNKAVVRSLSSGVDILGVVAFPYGLVPRRRVSRAALAVANSARINGYNSTIGKQLNSYIGLLGQSKSFLLRERLRTSYEIN